MDVLLSASTYEGFPISILEAMRYHIPLFLSDIPPHREAGGDAAFYYELGNYESFKETFMMINKEYSTLSDRGNRIFNRLQQFSIDHTIEEYLDVYRKVWEKRNR